MFKHLDLKSFIIGLFLLSINQLLFSQTATRNTDLTFDKLTAQLEINFHVKFFYKSEWFEMRSFNPSILKLSLNETLDRIIEETGYSIFAIDSGLYVFVPLKPVAKTTPEVKYSNEITVGNPDDYGKYTKATIQGKITDGINGNPLPGATLFIDKLKIGFMTDNNGNFKIQAPVGDYTVRLAFMGYEENLQKIKLVSNGTLNLELFEKSIKLAEVVISAKKAEINVSGTQMSYVSLDLKTIRELPVS